MVGSDGERCIVCDEPLTPATSAECNWCDGRYHLNQRNDVESRDCGAVWIDEQYLALQFACQRCLGADGQVPGTAVRASGGPHGGPPPRQRRYKRRA